MLPSFASSKLTIVRPVQVEDRYGNIKDDPEAGTRTVVEGCSVQPGATEEILGGRDSAQIRYTAYLPPGQDVRRTDMIDYKGTLFQIDGHPFGWESPTGTLDHMVLLLKDWEG